MKKILLTGLLALFCSISFASYNVGDLYGSYTVTGVDVPYEAEFILGETMGLPTIRFTEKMGEELECKGFFSVDAYEVNCHLYCGDHTDLEVWEMFALRDVPVDFSQQIDLSTIPEEDIEKGEFIATVKSSLYHNIPMRFRFVRD